MLCVHVAGDEPDTLTHDFRQNGFAISIDRCHLDQINDASPCVLCVVRFSPSQPEFIRPLPDQLTLQRPSLFIGQIGYRDLQHDSPLTAASNRKRSKPERAATLQRSLQFVLQLLPRTKYASTRQADFVSMGG
jgi:hypothetical protein